MIEDDDNDDDVFMGCMSTVMNSNLKKEQKLKTVLKVLEWFHAAVAAESLRNLSEAIHQLTENDKIEDLPSAIVKKIFFSAIQATEKSIKLGEEMTELLETSKSKKPLH